MTQPFLFGVNYWPRRKAMYWWSKFDAGEVREEFALIRDLNLNVVRLFLLWDDFQPEPDKVSPEALKNFGTVCDIAAENKLGLDVTFFTGHMSGPNWAPRWLLGGNEMPSPYFGWVRQLVSRGEIVSGNYRHPFTDPIALAAEKLLLTTIVTAYKDHPAIWMWNLGNEPDLFAWPPTAEAGRAWTRDMVQLIRGIDPHHPVTCGLHAGSMADDNGFRIDYVYGETQTAVMHGYPMYTDWAHGPLDPDHLPFVCALNTALCGKPTLMEEFGGCTAPPGEASQTWEWTAYGNPRTQFMASEEDLAEFLRQTLPRLVEVGATGAFLWCYADYIQDLWELPPCKESKHERFFGLVRPDGSLKPHAQVIKDFAATHPIVQLVPDYARFDVTGDEYYKNPGQMIRQLYQQYHQRLAAFKGKPS